MDNKPYKAVITSDHVDAHGEVMSLSVLESLVNTINHGKTLRMGVDHRPDFPPKGIIASAELVKEKDHHLVVAEFRPFTKQENVSWHPDLVKESFDQDIDFIEIEAEELDRATVSIDPANFSSWEAADRFLEEMEKDEEFSAQQHGRKSLIPDPEIIFTFAKSALIYQILKPLAKKVGEEIGTEIAQAIVKPFKEWTITLGKKIKRFASSTYPANKPTVIILDLPGKPQIQLLARTRDEKLIIKGLRIEKLEKVKTETKELSKHVDIAKIQFVLSEKGNWKLNYLITAKGESIGTREAIARRDHKFELMETQPRKSKKKSSKKK